MSELKATTAQEIVRNEKDCDYMDELFGGVKMPPTQVYLKSEADKVIADLEESHKKEVEQILIEVAELQKQVHDYAQGLYVIQARAEKEARHDKYKRCLAMADACRGNFLVAEHMIEKEPKNLMWHKRHKHYGRWMMLWRCFAEEFKEAKETLELVKKANALCKEAK